MNGTIDIPPHGPCNIVHEHKQEWAVCDTCGAQWALHGSDLEQVSEGDGFCEAHALEGAVETRETEVVASDVRVGDLIGGLQGPRKRIVKAVFKNAVGKLSIGIVVDGLGTFNFTAEHKLKVHRQ